MGSLMQERLLDDKGKLRPFDEWRKSIAGIAKHHLGSWLRTEYDTAVLRAHQAADWQEFERNRDILPNLRWMPTTSPTPEEAHKGYWSSGLTLPIDHPFWVDNHPANRWNCKCSLEATSEPASHGEVPDAPKAQAGLEENPRHGHTFSDKHAYYPSSCGACPFYGKGKGKTQNLLDKLFDNRKKDCYNCPDVDLQLDIANGYAPPQVETYKVEHNGKVLISPYHGANEVEENLRLAKFFADKTGERVYLLPRLDPKSRSEAPLRKILLPKGGIAGKNPDFYIRGEIYDGKSMLKVERGKSNKLQRRAVENRYRSAKEQASNAIIEIPKHIQRRNINKAIYGQIERSSQRRIVYIKYGNKLIRYKKRGD